MIRIQVVMKNFWFGEKKDPVQNRLLSDVKNVAIQNLWRER